MASLSDFIVSKVRVKILKSLLENPKEMYHVRELVRRTSEEINAVRRELLRMEEAGMVKKESRGNRLYYWFNHDYSYFQELLQMISKATGLGFAIRKNRGKIGKLSFVMFSGQFVRHEERKDPDQIDVLVVGDIVLPELANLVRQEETRRKTEINYSPMTKDEFEFRKSRRDPFILGILSGPRVMIIGSDLDFTK